LEKRIYFASVTGNGLALLPALDAVHTLTDRFKRFSETVAVHAVSYLFKHFSLACLKDT